MRDIKLQGRAIGPGHEPFIIAELSGNHNGSMKTALKSIEAAAHAGVDCLKIQTYTANTMTLNLDLDDFKILDENSIWNGRQLYELYEEAHTPWEWHEELFQKAKSLGLIAFSSPFDVTAVDFLETLDVPLYKIASFELTHLPLIEKVAKTGKPMIMSTGMAAISDIELALKTAREAGAQDIALLKCTSAYPASASDANLSTISDMRERFDVQIGLSDHTLGLGVAVSGIAYGATIIEKHFTLDRDDGGVDSAFSLEPAEFKLLKDETTRAWQARGNPTYSGTKNEQKSKQFRQSIFPNRPIKKGELFCADNLKICRPGFSLAPKYYKQLIGTPAKRDLDVGVRLSQEDL